MFKKSKVSTAVVLALTSGLAITAAPAFAQQAQQLERVEVTGSRIKRADAEGALPVTTIRREELEASGTTTVAEFIRTTTFSSFGNFRPQSGSSAQGFSEANLRGLGSRRTLVLVDGRRVAKDPQVGDATDMNSIPMAAVERIEILSDGASATYGSDAIGGVINVVLRKDFEGGVIEIGEDQSEIEGGDKKNMSAVFGVSGERGRIVAGMSANQKEIIFQRDYPWAAGVRGASSYGNNYFRNPGLSGFLGSAASATECNAIGNNFYFASGRCRFDFAPYAADEAAVKNKSIFARGETKINEDWSAYFNVSVSRTFTFGRYAPVPGDILIEPGTPADRLNLGVPYYLAHRFAAASTRDTTTDRDLYDTGFGVKGSVGGWEIDAGVRRTVSQFNEIGRGFVIETLARQAIKDGLYNPFNPFAADPLVIASFTATVGREGVWDQKEVYASVTKDIFKLPGGDAYLNVVAESRKEKYKDIYDSLSEGGVVLGSSGNSAGGSRQVDALGAELLMPISKTLEATLAARFEQYSDYGNDFSPKASFRYQPMKTLTLRGSYGEGFSAPTLPQLTQKPSFSADSVVDRQQCLADGNPAAFCDASPKPTFQINGLVISNPALDSEKSKQFALGGVWDITPALSVELTYWNTKIDGVITNVSAQTIVNRNNGTSSLPIPPGLSITRDSNGAIIQVVRGSTNEGTLQTGGIDTSIQLQHKWQNLGRFRHTLRYSWVEKYEVNGADAVGTFGAPQQRATLGTNWSLGPVSATWNINLIGKHGDDGVGYVGTHVTHDLQASYDTPVKGLKLSVGAINAARKSPARVSDDSRPFNFNLYDAYGATYYAKAKYSF
jgi:iron complex outermembrane receptor protein